MSRSAAYGARRRVRPVAPVAAVLAAVLLAACGGEAPASSRDVPADVGAPTSDPTVTVVDNDYEPDELVVAPGTTVRWEFEGGSSHDVEGDGFASSIQQDGSFEHTFEDTGSYPYRCTLHGGMTGTIYVVDG